MNEAFEQWYAAVNRADVNTLKRRRLWELRVGFAAGYAAAARRAAEVAESHNDDGRGEIATVTRLIAEALRGLGEELK